MLNFEERLIAKSRLQQAEKECYQVKQKLKKAVESLYLTRVNTAFKTINLCQEYINQLPKEFAQELSLHLNQNINQLKRSLSIITGKDYAIILKEYKTNTLNNSQLTLNPKNKLNSKAVTATAITGLGISTVLPASLMAFATTFGTASTGVAISSLSGAAATNAALAWLGGGALAAGGGGMAVGSALLMAGPIGLGISSAALGFCANEKNKEIAQETNYRADGLIILVDSMEKTTQKVKLYEKEALLLYQKILYEIKYLQENMPRNLVFFPKKYYNQIGTLTKTIYSLRQSITTIIDLNI